MARPSRVPVEPGERGQFRAFLETRGLVGGHRVPGEHVHLRTEDGVRLRGTYLPGANPGGPSVVVLHGLFSHRRKPAYAYLADRLSEWGSVLAIDLRGHGRSRGVSTLGDLEALDAEAAARWLRAKGHPWVALVGMSMGGTTAIHAVHRRAHVDAAVVISAPAEFREDPPGEPMQRLRRLWESSLARAGVRAAIGVRLVPPAEWGWPPHPEQMARDAHVPLLVIHGEDDDYFPISDAERLAAAAGDGARLWRVEEFGHAEDGVDAPFAEALMVALDRVHETGRFPAREDVGW
ncbi:MAG: alpha/beta fold hydrolase [Nitriliruptorales bacterium]|nr:alpha/beta fold hydrolase [Nitriliruptorales bacterium]